MIYQKIIGKYVAARLAETADAQFLQNARETHGKGFLSVAADAEAQARYLQKYKKLESAGAELYYIVTDKRGGGGAKPIGCFKMSVIAPSVGLWGNWILLPERPARAALECMHMVYELGFRKMDLCCFVFNVNVNNQKVLSVHRSVGAVEMHGCQNADGEQFFYFTPEAYQNFVAKYSRILGELEFHTDRRGRG